MIEYGSRTDGRNEDRLSDRNIGRRLHDGRLMIEKGRRRLLQDDILAGYSDTVMTVRWGIN